MYLQLWRGFFAGITLPEALPHGKVEGEEAGEQSLERVYAHEPKCASIHPSIPIVKSVSLGGAFQMS